MTKLKPMRDNVLVQRKAAEETSAGGIILPDAAKDKPLEGVVYAVGPGNRNDDGSFNEVGVTTGDKILFGKYAGTEITLEGNELLVISEKDIMAVIED